MPRRSIVDPDRLSTVVDMDRWDKKTFARDISNAPEVGEILEQHRQKFGDGPGTALDASLWASLYKRVPELSQTVTPDLKAIQHAVKSGMEMPQWAEMRGHTQLDQWGAALGLVSISKKLSEAIPDEVAEETRKAAGMVEEAQQWMQKGQAYQDAAQLTEDSALRQQLMQMSEEYAEKSAQVAESACEIGDKIDGKLEDLTPVLHRAVRQGVEEALDTMEATNQFCPGWGAELGAPTQTESANRFRLASTMMQSRDLLKLAKEIGRLKELGLHAQKTRVIPRQSNKTDITIGNNLRTVLPSEFSYLCMGETEDLFVKKYADSKLLQRHYKTKQEKREGPIIVCIDTSGSMSYGGLNIFAKGTALALMHIAARQKRSWACVLFGSSEEIKTFEFADPSKMTPEEVLNVATFEFGGGTDFEAPLREAVRLAEDSVFEKADIVFLSDGYCRVSDAFLGELLRIKKDKGLRIWSIAMPGCPEEAMKPFSDDVAAMTLQNDEDAIHLIFSNV